MTKGGETEGVGGKGGKRATGGGERRTTEKEASLVGASTEILS